MLHRGNKDGDLVGTAKLITVSLYLTSGVIVAALVALVCFAIHRQRVRAELDDALQAFNESTAKGNEAIRRIMDAYVSRPAVINDTKEEIALADTSDQSGGCFSALWFEGDELVMTNAEQEPILVNVDDAGSVRVMLAIRINQNVATNVRAYAHMPDKLFTDRISYIEALVTADNAMPYYARLAITLDNSVANADDEKADSATDSDQQEEEDLVVKSVRLECPSDSIVLHSNSSVDGQSLGYYNLFTSEKGAILGSKELDGEIPPGEENLCLVSWTINFGEVEETSTVTTATANDTKFKSSWLSDKYTDQLAAWRQSINE